MLTPLTQKLNGPVQGTGAEVKVWLILHRDTKANGLARTGQTDIARRAGLSVRGVKKAIRALNAKGMVHVLNRGRNRNRSRSRCRIGTATPPLRPRPDRRPRPWPELPTRGGHGERGKGRRRLDRAVLVEPATATGTATRPARCRAGH